MDEDEKDRAKRSVCVLLFIVIVHIIVIMSHIRL